MSKTPLVLSVVKLEVPEAPTMYGARVELHGASFEVVTVDLTLSGLMELSILTNQLAFDIEAARLLSKVAPLTCSGSATGAPAHAVVPVHIAQSLGVIRTADGGLLLDIRSVQREKFRLSISEEQAATVLLSLYPSASCVAQ